jgi:integrase/recombinase XerC
MSRSTRPARRETRGRKPSVALLHRARASAKLLAYVEEVDLRFGDYLAEVRQANTHSGNTLRWYAQAYESGLRPYLLATPVKRREEFRARLFDLDAWTQYLRQRVSPITVNNYWRAMRTFYNFMERADGTPNPYRSAKPPRYNPAPPKAKAAADCERILRAARNYPWSTQYERAMSVAVLGLMLYAGLRRGEVLGLDIEDVDFAGQTIHVRGGKGQHGGKSRFVPIAPQLDMLLRAYLNERKLRRVVVPEFFVGVRGRPLGVAGITVMVRKIRAAAAVRFTAHMLRHSFVTNLILRGVPLAVVRDVAGHSDFKTTLGYTAVQTPERLAAVAKLDFLSPPSRIRARR